MRKGKVMYWLGRAGPVAYELAGPLVQYSAVRAYSAPLSTTLLQPYSTYLVLNTYFIARWDDRNFIVFSLLLTYLGLQTAEFFWYCDSF